jgi:SNF2 family DNA or RNA helicase
MTRPAIQLMAHQQEGIDFLVDGRAGLLAFEQGLGKTLVAIEAFRRVKRQGSADMLLVICPNSLKKNWMAEIAKFAPELDTVIVEGTPRHRRQQFSDATAEVVITSYDTARSEVIAILALMGRRKTALVLDESHTAKTWRSYTSTAMRHFSPRSVYRWLLSGTPVTNSPADLFTQIEILAPGERRLGTMESFMATAESDPTSARAAIESLVLRRTKEQCLDLPDKLFVDVKVELPAWQRKLYNDMRTEMVCALQTMSGEEYKAFASTALAKLTRLIQIASNPALLFPETKETPGKFEALDGVIEEILAIPGRKVIIWSNFVKTIESLIERYKAHGTVSLYGGTPAAERQAVAVQFQTDANTRIMIANPAAAGTGFTLTAANYTIYETLSWRYDFYAQSQDRNHRIGQELPVTYMRIIAEDTIEEAIVIALQRKSIMAGELLGDNGESHSLSELTQEQMCHLLMHNELPNDRSSNS